VGIAVVGAVFALGVGASEARPAGSSQVTISMLANPVYQSAYQVLIANFERVYPGVTINASYAGNLATLAQVEMTELAAGNAPDLLSVYPGCGMPISVCVLARDGYLAPMLRVPWAKYSLPLVTSSGKYGAGLFVFEPALSPGGVFTNDDLFRKLGLRVPQTFAQVLALCQQAKAAGTSALIMDGASTTGVGLLLLNLAVAPVFGQDRQWDGQLRAGRVGFDSTPGWHQALQEFVDLNNSGCFQPGTTGTTLPAEEQEFDQGQGLMAPAPSSVLGAFAAAGLQFAYSFHPFPGGSSPAQTTTPLGFTTGLGVNAHSSAQNQAAAQTFVNFLARPKQDALFAKIAGGVTQYEFLHGQVPAFMSTFEPLFKAKEYVISPSYSWWNANVLLVLQNDGIGLLTGQESIDEILNAMDAAWKQGPS
jgi:raffinose/stachyose/melibiose transport system substrate-binding protein